MPCKTSKDDRREHYLDGSNDDRDRARVYGSDEALDFSHYTNVPVKDTNHFLRLSMITVNDSSIHVG